MVAFHMAALIYLTMVISYNDTFDVRIRLPSLTVMETPDSSALCHHRLLAGGLREVFAAFGGPLPSEAQDASFTGALVVMIASIPLRCLQLVLVGTHQTSR